MNLVDVVIILLLIGAVVHGLYLGAAIQVTSFAGFWGGLVLGSVIAPAVSRLGSDNATKVLLAALTVFGLAALLGGVGRAIGVAIWRAAARLHLQALDASLGAVVAGAATLLAAWIVAGMLAIVPIMGLSSEIQHSAVLRTLDRNLPPVPAIFARIQRLLDPLGFPRVFDGLEPAPLGPVALPSSPIVQAAAAKTEASVVRIVGPGCGGIQEGSGFVVGPGLVVTNAHVVAGTGHSVIQDRAGNHAATTVWFDPELDVAVLEAHGLVGPPLPMLATTVPRATQGAVLGYPEGGPLRVVPAAVLQEVQAVGRDIYGKRETTRAIYELQAVVRPGNSGGPIVEADGTVIGVVFARSSYNGDVGYALTSPEVQSEVNTASGHGAVSNGPCAA